MGADSRKLLIIDDDALVRESMVAYLEDSGYIIAEATSGQEGLERFDSFKPDLVLSDLMMPNIDGLAVLESIHTTSPDTPVIVISGVGVMNDVVSALRQGAADYLTKPIVDMEMLVHSIDRALERSELIKQNRRYREELEEKNKELSRNLRIFERDQKAGREVQKRLLPPNPVTRSGYTFSYHIHPSLYLSGDFIDYAYFLDRYFGFYLTDVAGHGASSAFVTIWLKYLVRNLMRDKSVFKQSNEDFVFNDGPNLLLQGINRELIATRLNNHLTSFHGNIDSKTHKLHYAVGGHLPMPIMLADDGARYLEGKGKPIGIFSNVDWKVYEENLPEKFALVLFSDGVLEILPGETLQDKEALLLETVSKLKGAITIDVVCDALGMPDIDVAPDDIAIMLITRGH
ncbi:response regulator [Aurantivibrio plasticivorans]